MKRFVTTGLFILASACATTENSAPAPDPDRKTHFVLRAGESVPQWPPLPSQGMVWLDWYAGDRLVESYMAYRVWDVDGDGRADMLDVLDEKGALFARAYDFDFDGVIDHVAYGSEIAVK